MPEINTYYPFEKSHPQFAVFVDDASYGATYVFTFLERFYYACFGKVVKEYAIVAAYPHSFIIWVIAQSAYKVQ